MWSHVKTIKETKRGLTSTIASSCRFLLTQQSFFSSDLYRLSSSLTWFIRGVEWLTDISWITHVPHSTTYPWSLSGDILSNQISSLLLIMHVTCLTYKHANPLFHHAINFNHCVFKFSTEQPDLRASWPASVLQSMKIDPPSEHLWIFFGILEVLDRVC